MVRGSMTSCTPLMITPSTLLHPMPAIPDACLGCCHGLGLGQGCEIPYASQTCTRPRMSQALCVAAAASGIATENASSEPLKGPFGHTCRAGLRDSFYMQAASATSCSDAVSLRCIAAEESEGESAQVIGSPLAKMGTQSPESCHQETYRGHRRGCRLHLGLQCKQNSRYTSFVRHSLRALCTGL